MHVYIAGSSESRDTDPRMQRATNEKASPETKSSDIFSSTANPIQKSVSRDESTTCSIPQWQ